MVQMGTITPKEREAAFQSMQGLLKAANIRTSSDRPASREPMSPAAALLASQRVAHGDQVEFSPEAIYPDPHKTEDYYANSISSSTRNDGQWHHLPAEALAEILQGERPIVIATVINQVSVERATAISQALPLHVAAATLAALPHLHLTDEAVLQDIQSELERKIGQYQAPKRANAEGLAKLQAIVANMPASQKSNWTNAIAQSNPVLATKLGWDIPSFIPSYNAANPLNTNPTPTATGLPSSLPSSNFGSSEATRFPMSTQLPSHSHPIADSNRVDDRQSAEEDIFDESMIIPFVSKSTSSTKVDGVDKQHYVAPKSENESLHRNTLEDMLHFSDRDFVAVLHACQPHTVLLLLSVAAKPFLARVERLMPAKDVKRLRERLKNLGPIQLRDIDAAQAKVAETALKMLASGAIAATASVSFTAAA